MYLEGDLMSDAEYIALCEKYGISPLDFDNTSTDDDTGFLDLSQPIVTKADEEYYATYGTMNAEEVEAALVDLEAKILGIDATVREFDGEDAALTAKELRFEYGDVKRKLERRQRDLRKEALDHLDEIGANDYGFDDDGNVIVTDAMEQVVAWHEAERAKLTEALELKMQETVRVLRNEGMAIDHNVRDRMYETLVDEEVIEQWEPVEF